jgi:hypothetical protein
MSKLQKYRPAFLALPVLAQLTGCGMAVSSQPPIPAVPIAQCFPVVPYSASQEAAQADAYDALPANSPLRPLIDDYGHERAALRACASVKP